MNIAIIGATGYGGVELMRLLRNHPKANVYSIHSSSQAGDYIDESYPHLGRENALKLLPIDPVEIAKNVDLVFMATPSGVSTGITPDLVKEGLKVIDLSGDFRIDNSTDYEKWYKKGAPPVEIQEKAVYGLPEWYKQEIEEAQVIANPGCYPTATLLGLAPLVKEGMVRENSIIIDAKSGVTGAGRSPSAIAHFPEMNDNFRIYKVNSHQHVPEIEQLLTKWNTEMKPISFSTHLLPISRGIMSTIYAELKADSSVDRLIEYYEEVYKNAPFVRIRKKGTYPSTKEVYGSNYCDIGIAVDDRTGRVMIVSVIDNIVKGAAGQAIQNMNIMMGIDERSGLDYYPVYP